jgi:hypothetical protein
MKDKFDPEQIESLQTGKITRLILTTHPAEIKATPVGSVDIIAEYVVGDQSTAMSIRESVCSLDLHDLTAVGNGVIPSHVTVPDTASSKALAASYAKAELVNRANKSGWLKTWGGWIVAVVLALVGVFSEVI